MNNREYHFEFVSIGSNLPEEKRTAFITMYNTRAYNPVVLFGLSVFWAHLEWTDFF